MIIDYTPEELKQLENIQAEYAAELSRLHDEIDRATDSAAIDKANDGIREALRVYNKTRRPTIKSL